MAEVWGRIEELEAAQKENNNKWKSQENRNRVQEGWNSEHEKQLRKVSSESTAVKVKVEKQERDIEKAAEKIVSTLRANIEERIGEYMQEGDKRAKVLEENVNAGMKNMVEMLKTMELASRGQKGAARVDHTRREGNPATNSYAQALRRKPQGVMGGGYRQPPRQIKFEEIVKTNQEHQLQVEELVDVYFYMNLIGNLGTIRRSLVHEVFKGRTAVVLNYNPHPSSRAGITQIICPKRNVQVLVEGLKEKKVQQLPSNYNPLGLSPRSNHLGIRRTKAL